MTSSESTERSVFNATRMWLLLAASAALLSFIMWRVMMPSSAVFQQVSGVHAVFTENGCSFSVPESSNNNVYGENSRRLLTSLVKKHSLACSGDSIIIYDLFGVFNKESFSGSILMASCQVKRNAIVSCKSHFIYSVNEDEK